MIDDYSDPEQVGLPMDGINDVGLMKPDVRRWGDFVIVDHESSSLELSWGG